MSYSVEIVESSSNFIELEATVGDNPPTIEIIQENSTEISISNDIALLPIELYDNIRTTIDNTLIGLSGIVIDPLTSGIIKIYSSGLQPSGNYSVVGHSHTIGDITNFSSGVNNLVSGVYAPLNSPTFTGIVSGITKNMVGLGNVDNTSDIDKPVSYAQAIANSGVQNYAIQRSNHVGTQNSSTISDFNTSVSGLIPILNISAGNGISISSNNKNFTVSVTGQFGLTGEQVDDRVNDLLKSGSYINLNYNDSNDSLTINVTGLQPSGNYSIDGHTHTSSNITDFNTAVSGFLPVKNIINGSYTNISNNSGLFTVNVTGLQPSGDYSINGHNHSISDITNLQDTLNNKQPIGNYATLVSGLIPSSQLPSYVDDVLEYGSSGNFPNSGETGKIYVTLDNNKTYRWGGTAYFEISASPGSTDAVPEGSINKYYTDAKASGAAPVQSVAGRIGAVVLTQNDVGLNNVDNTSDLNKPISSLTQTALNNKAALSHTHGNLSNDGKIGSLSGQIIVTTTSGLLISTSGLYSNQIIDFSSAVVSAAPPTINASLLTTGTLPDARLSNNVVFTTDSRLSDARVPLSHNHIVSEITNFGSGVSGLLPITTLTGNSGIYVTNNGSAYSISSTGLAYLSGSNFTSLSVTGIPVSISGHKHSYSDITNFGSGVQDSLTTTLLAGNFINIVYNSGLDTLTISSSGLQPSGNYSLDGHTHPSSGITDFNSSVSGLISGIYAPLNSPVLTGTPLAPTAPSGTNTTQIANTAFVRTEISNLVNAAPSTLDTLYELANAINNDPSFAATITANIGNKVSKSGDTMTGTLYAPSGIFSSGLSVNSIPVSISGHSHSSNDITNFGSAVSGLLPTNLVYTTGNQNISGYKTFQNRVVIDTSGSTGLSANLPLIISNAGSDNYFSFYNGINGTGYALFGLNNTSYLNDETTPISLVFDNTNPINSNIKIGGVPVSVSGHLHTTNDIINFSNEVSGLLPTINGSGYINTVLSNNTYTISASGLQPSGNYANAVHGHGNISSSGTLGFGNKLIATDENGSIVESSVSIEPNRIYLENIGLKSDSDVDTEGQFNITSVNNSDLFSISHNAISGINIIDSYQYPLKIIAPSSVVQFQTNGSGIYVDNTLVSVSGHSHNSNDISNFGSAVSGLLPSFATELDVYVKNTTGGNLYKGQAVYINGAQGDNPTITLAIASSEPTSSKTLGLLKQNLALNEFGYVITEGLLEGIDTNDATAAGDAIWLSPSISGGLVYGLNNKPYAPNHLVFIGYVLRKQQNNGKIYIKPQNGFELQELHNVAVTGATNGQFLQYDSVNQLWVPSSSGNFTTLKVNSTDVSVSGHTHNSSDITNFGSAVSGLVSGVYAPLTGTLNQFANTSSSQLAGVITDETGSGSLVFASSPTLTGIPLVPTATSGTNTNQAASTAFVRTEISNLVASAPSTLDTLNELANALNNDASFSTTMTNYLGTKANLAGASFSGSISAPTGNFTVLQQNNVVVSVSGHSHVSNDITNFATSVSGLLPTIANSGDNRILTSTGSSVGINAESNATFDGTNFNISGILNIDNIRLDDNTISSTNTNGNINLMPEGDGKIGIGNNSPIYNLDVFSSNDNATLRLGAYTIVENLAVDQAMFGRNVSFDPVNGWISINDGASTAIRMNSDFDDGSIAFYLHPYEYGGTNLTSWDSSDIKMIINNNGNVGIGTSTPSYKLDVAGTGNFSQNLMVNDVPVSVSGHSHNSLDISNFDSSVSGLLPVKNVVNGTYISVSSSSGTYTISATGLQPSGNYSISGHVHSGSDITTGTVADARLSTNAQAAINIYLWSSFK